MKLKRLAGALLMIAAGLLACWAARGSSSNTSDIEWSVPGMDKWLLSIYSDGLAGPEIPMGAILPPAFEANKTRAATVGQIGLPVGIDWDTTSHLEP